MTTVITYGTFDLFHKGHYNILKRAKEAGDYLIVGVTGESYDKERGKLSVQDSLAVRIENVRKTGFADKIIVEEYLGQKIHDIAKYNVDILVIGSDWRGKFDHLNKYCEVRYLERTKNISSTQLRDEMGTLRYGIVTDSLLDNGNVTEPKHVSGIHVECVYSRSPDVAREFCQKHELNHGYTDFDDFLNDTDIVYIKTVRKERAEYVRRALAAGRHVICDAPETLDPNEHRELMNLARTNNCIFIYNVPIAILQAFDQLLWMVRGNLIGDIVSVKSSIASSAFSDTAEIDFCDLAYYTLCTTVKILGTDYKNIENTAVVDTESGELRYSIVNVEYDNAVSISEISMGPDVDGEMTIIGTEGTIIVPEQWWTIGYFKLKKHGERVKKYSFNLEGNGFRYLIQSLLHMIHTDAQTERITAAESETIIRMLNELRSK